MATEIGQIAPDPPSWEGDGPSSHETCGQFPADDVAAGAPNLPKAAEPATGAPPA